MVDDTSTADTPIGVYIFGAGSNIQIIDNHIHNIATTAKGKVAEDLLARGIAEIRQKFN